ncbi:MAG: J domain-containing protein [Planctomycetes bacterium]|nr:J domain-containing protein [Planctomycetota bacterium]
MVNMQKMEIFTDYQLFFGRGKANPVEHLRNISLSELKTAYRKKVMETHPDRAIALGKAATEMAKRFKDVATAYQRLITFVQGKYGDVPDEAVCDKKIHEKIVVQTKPEPEIVGAENFYHGAIPKRKLLIGQYLYYCRHISWKTLIEAIMWQKKQRPRLGQIALEWGILSVDDIKMILAERTYKEKFGEFAYRKGYLTYFEFLAVLGRQYRLQPPIGRYFNIQNILGKEELEEMVEKLKIWNNEVEVL